MSEWSVAASPRYTSTVLLTHVLHTKPSSFLHTHTADPPAPTITILHTHTGDPLTSFPRRSFALSRLALSRPPPPPMHIFRASLAET